MKCEGGVFGTTAGILSTLGVIGTGVGFTLWQAAKLASECKTGVASLVSFTTNFNNITTPATVFINGIPVDVIFLLNNPLRSLFGNSTMDAMSGLPNDASNICDATIKLAGLAFTAIATTGICLFTYNYHTKKVLEAKLKKLETQEEKMEEIHSTSSLKP